MSLTLERRVDARFAAPAGGGVVAITPPISPTYWTYRVVVSDGQAVVGFPKFGTIGIGFAVEEDWNTNLPYTNPARRILDHIGHNRGPDAPADEVLLSAIDLIRHAAMRDRDGFRTPYVEDVPFDSVDGARRSAQIDREEADGLDQHDSRRTVVLESAALWDQQAARLQKWADQSAELARLFAALEEED
jgi:hypothetical protein